MLADLNVAFDLPWMAFRYFNAAGVDPQGEIGEAHDPETHLTPLEPIQEVIESYESFVILCWA